jgi:hypothetical protein
MTDAREGAFVAQMGALVNDLQRREVGIDAGLTELVESAVAYIPGSRYAGITVAHRSLGISTAAATHRYPVLLDELQQRHQDGPCVSAAWEHHTVHIDDLAAERRWPDFSVDAAKKTPIRSILSFELFVDSDALAALNFYAERPGAFGEESIDLGVIFSAHVALAWGMLRRDEQFRSGLASRDRIGQAKGIVMERFDVDAVQAFELLKRLSQQSNTKLVDIAQRVIETRGSQPRAETSAGTP